VLNVAAHLAGVKNGKGIGRMCNIAAKDAAEIKIDKIHWI